MSRLGRRDLSRGSPQIELGVTVEKPIGQLATPTRAERAGETDDLGRMQKFGERGSHGFVDALQTRTSVVATDVRPVR